MTADLRFRIYNLGRSPEGYWRAFVSFNGAKAIELNKRHGSWQTLQDENGTFKDAPRAVSIELQRQVRARENPRTSKRKEAADAVEA